MNISEHNCVIRTMELWRVSWPFGTTERHKSKYRNMETTKYSFFFLLSVIDLFVLGRSFHQEKKKFTPKILRTIWHLPKIYLFNRWKRGWLWIELRATSSGKNEWIPITNTEYSKQTQRSRRVSSLSQLTSSIKIFFFFSRLDFALFDFCNVKFNTVSSTK